MKPFLILPAILLFGCARNYRVCLMADDPICMRHQFSRGDATAVASAMASLGYQPYLERGKAKSTKPSTPAPAPEPDPEKTKL